MSNRIKIYPWATDTIGCLYQRLTMPLGALEAAYPEEFEVCWTCEPKGSDGPLRDIVIGQRIMGNGENADPRWQAYCRDPDLAAVYEIDDDILDLDEANAIPHSIFTPNRIGTLSNVIQADAVIASTPNLADKLRPYNPAVHVAVNSLAAHHVLPGPRGRVNPDTVTVGYAGSQWHAADWPATLVGRFAEVRDYFGASVRWVSIGTNYFGWGSTFQFAPMADYHTRLNFIDIGIAPIAHTEFNRSKSWIKALDYMAHGVVPVVEDWGQYPDLIGGGFDEGLGLIVERNWSTDLIKAIQYFQAGYFDQTAILDKARSLTIENTVAAWATALRAAAERS